MEKKFINPSDIHAPRGYTHVVTVEGGKLAFISGQVAIDQAGNLVGKGDLRSQAQKAAENLVAALRAIGATPADIVKMNTADIVKMNTYVVNYKPDDYRAIREVRAAIFTGDNPPASTLVGVQALAVEGLLIEIEAVAAVK